MLRWLDILALGIVASATFTYTGRWFSTAFTGKISAWLQPSGALGAQFLALALALTLIALLHRLARTDIGHLRHFLQYPPLPVAVMLGVVLATAYPLWLRPSSSFHVLTPEAATAAGLYLLFWLAQVGAQQVWHRLARIDSAEPTEPNRPTLSKISDEDLKQWLKREEALTKSAWDLFGHAMIAGRLVDRLLQEESTTALQGEYGSGKSSICSMAAAEAKRRGAGLIFVRASCWGFENAAAAQKRVLEAILAEVGREVDQVRELAQREHPAGIVLNQLDPLVAEDDNYRIFDQHLGYHWPWQLSLCGVLNRPWLLKHALRRTLDA